MLQRTIASVSDGPSGVVHQFKRGGRGTLVLVDEALDNIGGPVRGATVKNHDHVLVGGDRLVEQTPEAPFDVNGFVVHRDHRR